MDLVSFINYISISNILPFQSKRICCILNLTSWLYNFDFNIWIIFLFLFIFVIIISPALLASHCFCFYDTKILIFFILIICFFLKKNIFIENWKKIKISFPLLLISFLFAYYLNTNSFILRNIKPHSIALELIAKTYEPKKKKKKSNFI